MKKVALVVQTNASSAVETIDFVGTRGCNVDGVVIDGVASSKGGGVDVGEEALYRLEPDPVLLVKLRSPAKKPGRANKPPSFSCVVVKKEKRSCSCSAKVCDNT